jgi:hypothetical protein
VFRVATPSSGSSSSSGGAGSGASSATGEGVELMVKVDDVENLGRFVQVSK